MTVDEYIKELQNDIAEIGQMIGDYDTYGHLLGDFLSAFEKKKCLLKWLEEYKMLKENMEDDRK